MAKLDYYNKPVRKMVILGESISFGMCASDPRNEWVQVVANLIRDFQDKPLKVLNNAIPANVVSPRSNGYKYLPEEALPTAIERYGDDLINHNPDLTILSYGLNDSSCGTPVKTFIEDYEKIISDVSEKTKSLIIVTSPYWSVQHDKKLWNNLKIKPDWATGEYSAFAKTGRQLVWDYFMEIKRLSGKYGCLFVDIFTPLEECVWMLNNDTVHYNDLGHRVIGQIVFNAIACNCSFTGGKSKRIEKEGNYTINNTGGTNGTGRMISSWLNR
jgi:lysophospholipase L1-like esterase